MQDDYGTMMQAGQRPLGERIAVLEAQHDTLDRRFTDFETKLDLLVEAASKQKGLIGGATLVVTGLVTAFTLFKDWVLEHIR